MPSWRQAPPPPCSSAAAAPPRRAARRCSRARSSASRAPGLAAPGAATRPTQEAHHAKKTTDKEGTQEAYRHKGTMIDFYLEHLQEHDVEQRYFNPEYGTDLAEEQKGPLVATNILRWLGDRAPYFYENAKELYNRRKLPPQSLQWGFVQTFHAALQQKFADARKLANPGRAMENKKLLDYTSYLDQYNAIKQRLNRKGAVDVLGPDPQVSTVADTYNFDEYRAVLAKYMLVNTLPAARAASEFTFMHSSVGRGDDMALLRMSHLLLFNMACISPCPFFVLAGVLKGGKMQETGAKGYKGVPRNVDLVVCPWRYLAFYFFRRFVQSGEEFPDPTCKAEWRLRALWAKTTNPNESWDYKEKNKTVHSLFDFITSMAAVVHAFRKGGARALQEAGLSHEVIGQLGMWLTSAMVKSYLTCFPPDAMLSMAGLPQHAAKNDFDMYWHERFTLVVPRELVDHFFPFLAQFEKRMAEMPPAVLREEVSVSRMRQVLHALAIAGVQDCLWMAADKTHKEYLEIAEVQRMMQHPDFVERVEAVKCAKRIGFWVGRKPMTAKELVMHLATLHLMPTQAARCLLVDGLVQELALPVQDVSDLQQAQLAELEEMLEAVQPECDPEGGGPEVGDSGVAAVLEAMSPSRSGRRRPHAAAEGLAPIRLDMDGGLPPPPPGTQQQGSMTAVSVPAEAVPRLVSSEQQQQGSGAASGAVTAAPLAGQAGYGVLPPPLRPSAQQPPPQQPPGSTVLPGGPPPLMQVLMGQLPLQQPPPLLAGVQQVLPPQFLTEQGLSYAAPFGDVMPSLISHSPAYAQYQPHIGHVLGAAASGQRLLHAQYMQQQHHLHQQHQTALLGGLTYPTAADGSFSLGVPSRLFVPHASLGGQPPAAGPGGTSGELEKKRKKGTGSRRDMSGDPRLMPTLSYFDSQGGYVKVWNWYAVAKDHEGFTRLEKEQQQLQLHPADIPEWRKGVPKQRFSEFKKLVDHIQQKAEQQRQFTGRAVSPHLAAQQLEEERQTAKKGKKLGFTAMIRQMQAAARTAHITKPDSVESSEEEGG